STGWKRRVMAHDCATSRWRPIIRTAATAGLMFFALTARADRVTLQDGRVLEGKFTRLNTLIANPGVGNAGMPNTKLIGGVDNDLGRTYFPEKFMAKPEPTPPGQTLEEIDLDQSVCTVGQRIGGVGAIIKITPFDKYGRRTFSMTGGPKGRVDVIQG